MTALPLAPPAASTTRTRDPQAPWVVATGTAAGLVLAQWVSGIDWTSPGETITSLSRLAGLAASFLLLLQVVLMARVPAVERAFGQDRLAGVHRTVGFTSFSLVLAHVVLTLGGYSLLARRNPLSETAAVVWDYPGMLLATASFALLVLVVVTSVKAARATLRYESWHLLHLYAYLGIGLALPHQLWTGGDLVDSAAARLLWTSAYVGTLAVVLVCRVGLPLRDNARWQLRVAATRSEAPGVTTVAVTGRALPTTRAGQFFVFRFRDGRGWTAGNPYSLSAAPDGRALEVTAHDRTGRLARLRPGTRVYVEGPYGRLTRTSDRLVLVLANGIGVTPGIALLQEAGGGVLVHRGARLLATPSGVVRHQLPGPRASRGSWLPQSSAHLGDAEALHLLVPDLLQREVFVAGTADWVALAESALRQTGLPDEQLHVEMFSW